MALSALLLVAVVSAKHQVLQWGQHTIRPAGSYLTQPVSPTFSFGEPEWLPADILGTEEVADMHAGPSGSLIWKSVSGKWFISGVTHSMNGGGTPDFYYPVELNFTATDLDSSAGGFYNLWDIHFAPTPNSPTPPAVTTQIITMSNRTYAARSNTPVYWSFRSLDTLSDTSAYASPFVVGDPVTSGLTCTYAACGFIAGGRPYIYGYFNSPTDPLLGPDTNSEGGIPSNSASTPAWDKLCGVASQVPNTVTEFHLGSNFFVSVSASYDNVTYQTINLWGTNNVGQLGNTNLSATCWSFAATTDYFTGLPANAILSNVSVGSLHTLALFSNGMVYAWGDNSRGQLGISTSTPYSATPVKITFPNTPSGYSGAGSAPTIVFVGTWGLSSFAADANGLIYAWGSNSAPNAIAPFTPSLFDGGIGALGFGKSRPTLSYLSTPTIVPLSIPTGSKLLKIVPPYLWPNTVDAPYGIYGDAMVNFIFDVPTPVTYTAIQTSNDPYLNPVATGNNVLMTWGSPIYAGVANFYETWPVPRPVPADLSRSLPLSAFGDIVTSGNLLYAQNTQANGFWYFGRNDGRLLKDGVAGWIETPYSSRNTSEGAAMNATLKTVITASTAIFQNAPASGVPSFTCVSVGVLGTAYAPSFLTASEYSSSKIVKNVKGSSTHWIIEYADYTIDTCTNNCQVVNANGNPSYLGRANNYSKCAPPAGVAGSNVVMSAVGDSVTIVWVCDGSVTSTCTLGSFGTQTLGSASAQASNVLNSVDISGVSTHITDQASSIKAIECGYGFCAVLCSDGAIVGWGNITFDDSTGDEFIVPIVLLLNYFDSSETIVQISAVGRALFILTSQGKVYGFGQGRSEFTGYMTSFPFLDPIIKRPAVDIRWLEELSTVNDVQYFYTRLMNSSSLDVSPIVGFAAIGYAVDPATHPLSPPVSPPPQSTPVPPPQGTKKDANVLTPSPTPTEYVMYSWGDNIGNTDILYGQLALNSYFLANGDAVPLITEPTQMFPALYTSTGDGLPFDPSTASFVYSAHQSYALTPEGDVYYWGLRPFTEVHPDATVYDANTNGPMLLMRGISKMAPIGGGIMYVQNDGYLTCSASPGTTSYCSGTLNDTTGAHMIYIYNPIIDYPDPPKGAFTDFACSASSSHCVGLWNQSAFSFIGTYSNMAYMSGPVNMGAITAQRVWVAGVANTVINSTAPLYHWLYTRSLLDPNGTVTGTAQSYGWSALDSASAIQYVGLDAADVVKIVVGSEHVLVLLSNGSLAGWGWTSYGQLGQFNTYALESAVLIHPTVFGNGTGLAQIADIGASNYASLVLTTSGDVYSWGVDSQGAPSASDGTDTLYVAASQYYASFSVESAPIFVISHEDPVLVATDPSFTKLISGGSTGFTGSVPTTSTRMMIVGVAPPPAEPPVATPSPPASQCPPPKPALATCVLYQGKYTWTITQAALQGNNQTIVINNNVLIIGNLTISSDSPIQIRPISGGNLPMITVTDYASIIGAITVTLDDDDLKAISKLSSGRTANTTVLEASGITLTSSPTDSLKVESTGKKCRKASAKSSQTSDSSTTRSGLATVISVNSSSCNNWWIILVSVVCGIILLVLIFLIVYFSSPAVQQFFRPYKGSGGNRLTTA